MAEWIDIPAQRLLRITHEEACRDFTAYDEDGRVHELGNCKRLYRIRIRRNSDGKRFELSPLMLVDDYKYASYCLREV